MPPTFLLAPPDFQTQCHPFFVVWSSQLSETVEALEAATTRTGTHSRRSSVDEASGPQLDQIAKSPQKIVKSTDYTYTCNSLTILNMKDEQSPETEILIYVLKKSWNHRRQIKVSLFLVDFCHFKLLCGLSSLREMSSVVLCYVEWSEAASPFTGRV